MTQNIENVTRTMIVDGLNADLMFTEVYGHNVFTALLYLGKMDVENGITETHDAMYYICYLAQKEEKTHRLGEILYNDIMRGTWRKGQAMNVLLSL